MKKIQNTVVLLEVFLLSFVVIFSSQALAATKKANIINIPNLSVDLKQNEKYSLPKTVVAKMSDKSKKSFKVSWGNKTVDTSKTGSHVFLGSVTGYKNKIRLSINVFAFISNIADIEITIKQNQKLDLPTEVTVELSDGTTNKSSVSWDTKEIKDPGTYHLEGTVQGYEKKAQLKLVIEKLLAQDIAKESQKIVLVNVYNIDNELIDKGSGIIISKDGLVVTNYHVINYGDHIQVVDYNNQTYNIAYVVDYDKTRDLAILKIDSSNEFEAVSIGDSDKLELNQEVIAIGSTRGLQNAVSNGTISSIRTSNRIENTKDIQITAPISQGNCGGALFNLAGEAIGITYVSTENGQNLNFAIPINEVSMLSRQRNLTVKKLYEYEHVIVYNNARYEGEIENKKPNGYGYMEWNDNGTYSGNWVNGQINGKGTREWKNGDIYTGDWVNDVRTGYGTYIWGIGTTCAGDIYEGQFVNGKMDGNGIYIGANGKITTGTWADNKAVNKTSEGQYDTWELLYLSDVSSVPNVLFNDCYFDESGENVYYVYPKFDANSYIEYLKDDGFTRSEDYTTTSGIKIIKLTKNNYELNIALYSDKIILFGKIH